MSDQMPSMYDELADWFHLLTPPSDYVDDAALVMRLLEAHLETPPLMTALELGSGGGNTASHLADRLQLTLTDPSERMLALSHRLNPGVEHLVGDMRTLRLGRTFDAVIAHDAITYMRDEAELRSALETAFVHLRPGGAAVFLPDWTTGDYVPDSEHGGIDEGGRGLRFLEWDRPIEPDGHTVKTDYVIVTRDEAGSVAVHHDVHTLGIFPRATWLRLLQEVGFEPHVEMGLEGLDAFVGVRRSPVT